MGKGNFSRETCVKGIAAVVLAAASLGILRVGDYILPQDTGAEAGDAAVTEAEAVSVSGLTLTPGTYTATAKGMSDVTVTCTIDETGITDMTVDVSGETPGLGADIGDQMIEAILGAQSTEVDNVSGVTITSTAIKTAVGDCLAQASGSGTEAAAEEAQTEAAAEEASEAVTEAAEEASEAVTEAAEEAPEAPAADAAAGGYTPGTYTAAGQGINGDVTVEVTFDESSITDMTVDVSGETAGLGADIGDQMIEAVMAAQSSEVDGVAGVTVTSDAIKAAVADCIAQASAGSADAAEAEEPAAEEAQTEAAAEEPAADAETEFTGVLAGGPEAEETEEEPETPSGLEGVLAAGTQAEGAAEPAEESAAGAYVPGTYTASAKGIESDVAVEVTFDESSITDVTVDVSGETAGIGAEIGDVIVKQILEAQSDGVDGVAGATITSDAVKAAVADCIAQASEGAEAAVEESSEAAEESSEAPAADAAENAETEFTGVLAGGPEIEETEAEPETPSGLEGVLAAGVPAEDAEAQAGEAESEEEAEEGAAGAYVPGTYTASAKGIGSDVTVEVTFDGSSITDVTIDVSGETVGIGAEIGDLMAKRILEAQSDGVDGVAGATITSDAVKAAVADCIAQAASESGEDAAETEAEPETEAGTESETEAGAEAESETEA